MEQARKELHLAIRQTWESIGSDFLQLYEEEGETPDNESIYEGVMDANRVDRFCTPAALELLRTMDWNEMVAEAEAALGVCV